VGVDGQFFVGDVFPLSTGSIAFVLARSFFTRLRPLREGFSCPARVADLEEIERVGVVQVSHVAGQAIGEVIDVDVVVVVFEYAAGSLCGRTSARLAAISAWFSLMSSARGDCPHRNRHRACLRGHIGILSWIWL